MTTPEEQSRIDNARQEKNRQIQTFADNKTNQIIITSTYGVASALATARLMAGEVKSEEWEKVRDELWDSEERKLREAILGTPF